MSWLRRFLGGSPDTAAAPRSTRGPDAALDPDPPFACTTCGRTDLPPAGDWDPPICQECDAAINFDALEEAGLWEEEQ